MGIARPFAAGTVLFGEQAHHETGRAIAALGAAGVHQGLLCFGEGAVMREGLDGVDLLAGQHRQEQQAAIDGHVGAPRAVLSDYHHSASAALPFGAAFLGAGEALRAQEIEQCVLGVETPRANGPAIEKELKSGTGVRVECHYCPIERFLRLYSMRGEGWMDSCAAVAWKGLTADPHKMCVCNFLTD